DQCAVLTGVLLTQRRMGTWLQSRHVFSLAPMLPIHKGRQLLLLVFQSQGKTDPTIVESTGTLSRSISVCINEGCFFPASRVRIHRRRTLFKVIGLVEDGIVHIPVPGLPLAAPYNLCPLVHQGPAEIKMVQQHMGSRRFATV